MRHLGPPLPPGTESCAVRIWVKKKIFISDTKLCRSDSFFMVTLAL